MLYIFQKQQENVKETRRKKKTKKVLDSFFLLKKEGKKEGTWAGSQESREAGNLRNLMWFTKNSYLPEYLLQLRAVYD